MIKYKKYKKWLVGIAILLVALLWFFSGNGETNFYTAKVTEGNVDQIVYVTGTVESDLIVNLKFKQLGTVESIYVKQGDRVEMGDKLMELDNSKLEISANRAKATLDIAKADLSLEYAGPKRQEIEISQTKIDEAKVNLENSKQKLKNTKLINEEESKSANLEIQNAEIALSKAQKNHDNTLSSGETDVDISNQALENAYDESKTDVVDSLDLMQSLFFDVKNFLGSDKQFEYEEILSKNASLQERMDVKNSYVYLKRYYDEANQNYNAIKISWGEEGEKIESLLDLVNNSLLEAKTVVDILYGVVSDADPYLSLTQTALDSLSTTYSAKQDLLSASINLIQISKQEIANSKLGLTSTGLSSDSGVDTAFAQLEDAKNNLEIAMSALEELRIQNEIEISEIEMEISVYDVRLKQKMAEHNKLVASPRGVDVASLVARIARDQADYDRALKELSDSILVAPVDGFIAKVNLDAGENVSDVIEDAITLMADKLSITTNISETDIAKVAVGDSVGITFDAFPSDVIFDGKIITIDPAETVVQGVIYYEAKIDFNPNGKDIKSGMTANCEVMTDSVEGVLIVPAQALNYENNEVFVFVVENDQKIRKVVKIGLEGDEFVEVIDGLSDGDEVLIYESN